MIDMFEHYDKLPKNVKKVLAKYDGDNLDYNDCAKLVRDLNKVGWTCDYYLDAEPYGLRKLSEFDKWDRVKIDRVFEAMMDEISHEEAEEIRKEIRTRDEKIIYFIDCEERFKAFLK